MIYDAVMFIEKIMEITDAQKIEFGRILPESYAAIQQFVDAVCNDSTRISCELLHDNINYLLAYMLLQ